jgi:hypothetical protein
VVKALRYKPAGRGFDSRCCHWNFSVTQSFRSHYGLGVYSASNRNEYQVYFLGGKGGRCVRLTNLPPSCAVAMKSGNLNFLEHSGPLQTCNGTALPYFFTRKKYYLLPLCHIFHNTSHMDFFGNQTGKLSHSYISYENFISIKLNCYS